MARADLLQKEGLVSEYLVVMKPDRQVTTWTQDLSLINTWTASFDFGQVIAITENGTVLTEASSTTLSAGEWYYDLDNETIYVRVSDSGDPNTDFIVATYEIYAGTVDAHFHRIPTDDTSRVVYYEPIISRAPSVKESMSDSLVGFVPSEQTSITLSNGEGLFEKHLYDSSFHQKRIDVYHYLKDFGQSEILVENLALIIDGRMGNIRYGDDIVTIQISDKLEALDKEFRSKNASFYGTSDYSGLDPDFIGAPIRTVFGRVGGFVPVNVDTNKESPSVTNNRTWAVRANASALSTATCVVTATSSGTTVTVDSTAGFWPGDMVEQNTPGTGFATVVSINSSTSMTFDTSVSVTPSDTFDRLTISSVWIIHEQEIFKLRKRTHYTETTLANDVLGFTITNNVESLFASWGSRPFDPNVDVIVCSVYGQKNTVTLSASSYGTDDADIENLAAPGPVLVEILKENIGVSEDDLDNQAFIDLNTATTEAVSLSIPKTALGTFPTMRELIADFTLTLQARFFKNNDNEFSIARVDSISSTSATLANDEMVRNSFSYELSYRDLASKIEVLYERQERDVRQPLQEETFRVADDESLTARYLHGVEKTMDVRSLHLKTADASGLAAKLAAIFGDRRGTITLSTKNRFFDTLIDDKITLSRDRLPGFEFSDGTDRERDAVVISTDRDLRQIRLTFDDQKGVEDNAGDF